MNKVQARKIFANNLIALLSYKNKTRKDISQDLNITYARVCDWSRARTYPNEIELGKLANYFDTTIEQLTNGDPTLDESKFEPEQATQKSKVSVIDISTEEWINHPVDYEWVSSKYLEPERGYLIFDVADNLMIPKYNIGDTIMAEFLNNRTVKEDGDYLVRSKEHDSWLFLHIYCKKDSYLVTPLNIDNSKSILPKLYTKKEFLENFTQPHKAVRVSKNI